MSTPKTLQEAIQNGVDDLCSRIIETGPKYLRPCEVIEIHVRDFYAQQFGAAMLENESAETLWNRMIKEGRVK